MAFASYPERSITSPEAQMLRPPVTPIPKCWEADLRPLTFRAASLDRLPDGEAKLALLLKGTAEGAGVQEVSAPGYARQCIDFHLHVPGRSTSNIHPVVFRFDDQPNATIPLIGLFVDEELVMRGGLKRLLVPPEGVELSAAAGSV